MDAKYFYVKDNEPIGPLTIEELLEKDISSKTYVWRKGMENWVMAENMPELFKALQLKTENPPRFQNEDTIEYKEEKPPHFQKEALIEQKEENPPQSKKEKRNQILNSILLVIVIIAGLCLTAFAFFEYDSGYGVPIGWSIIFGYVLIGGFGYFLAEKLRLGDIYLYFIYILFGIFFVGGVILTVISFTDWGSYLWNILPYFITHNLNYLWAGLVILAIFGSFIYFVDEYIPEKLNLPENISGLKILFFIGGILLIILDWINDGEISRNSGFVMGYELIWGVIVIGFLLIIIYIIFKDIINWLSGKTNDLLNKNLTKTKWFLLIGCLILGLTVVYIQIKNVKLRAENLQLEKKLSKNTPTWSYNTAISTQNAKYIDINFRFDKTKKLMINNIEYRFIMADDNNNKVRTVVRSGTTISSIKIIDNSNATHNIRQR